jgi:monoamine oxidase
MKEARITRTESGGSFWNMENGKLKPGFRDMKDMHILEKALADVKEDTTIDAFIDKYLKEYEELKQFVKEYAEGYDVADTSRASILAFRNEWNSGDEEQSRVDGGYSRVIDFLVGECKKYGGEIIASTVVTEVKWNKNNVNVVSKNGFSYSAEKIVITVPAGILQEESGEGSIRFIPAISDKIKGFNTVGFGNAMKVFLQFKIVFWQKDDVVKQFGKEIKNFGFVISDAQIPVWWTQAPVNAGILTGWIGGPNTHKFADKSEEEILEIALGSIEYIFSLNKEVVREELKAWKIIDWSKNPYEKGGYTYATVEEQKIKNTIGEPVNDTLYFAGEAFYTGVAMGTVEAALSSGKKVAEVIIGKLS